jgi:hypothetical protein
VAKLWRSVWGETRFLIPAASAASSRVETGSVQLRPGNSHYSLRVFSPAGAVEVNSSSKTGVDATIW